MAWTLCTSGAAVNKAGVNANSTITASGAALENWSDEVENEIATLARSDVIGNYANLTTNGKQVIGKLCSSMIAQNIVSYDKTGYLTMSEADQILNVLENDIRRIIPLITEDKNKTYLGIT